MTSPAARPRGPRRTSERARIRLFQPFAFLDSPPGGRRWWGTAWRALSLPLLVFLALPILGLILRASPALVLEGLAQPQVRDALQVSFQTTLTATALIILSGTPIALLLARESFRGKRLLETLVDLPTVLPPSVAGVALLITLGRRGLIGAWFADAGLELAFTPTAVVLAQTFVAAPFYIRAASLGFAAISREIEEAAQLDGAGSWELFRFVILPLSTSALLSGAVMSWARALGEFGATILFAGNLPGRTQTMPLAIYLGFEVSLTNALTLSVLLIGTSFMALLIVRAAMAQMAENGS